MEIFKEVSPEAQVGIVNFVKDGSIGKIPHVGINCPNGEYFLNNFFALYPETKSYGEQRVDCLLEDEYVTPLLMRVLGLKLPPVLETANIMIKDIALSDKLDESRENRPVGVLGIGSSFDQTKKVAILFYSPDQDPTKTLNVIQKNITEMLDKLIKTN